MKLAQLILLVLAALLFLLAGIGVQHPRINLLAWGLFAWVLATILPLTQ